MSLKPNPIPPVPPETARVARAAFPKGNIYMKLRERVGLIIQDEDFVALFSKEGAPGLPPWRLALVTRVAPGWHPRIRKSESRRQGGLTSHSTGAFRLMGVVRKILRYCWSTQKSHIFDRVSSFFDLRRA